MLEVDVYVALLGESGEALGEGVDLVRGVAAGAAEAEGGVSGGGVDLGGDEVVGFSYTEGGVVQTEDVVGLFGEPGWVAELEGDLQGFGGWKGGEEGGEESGVGGEVGWELEEEQAELAGLPEGFERFDELGEIGVAVLEPFEVGDALWGLEAETESGRSCGGPSFCEFCGWEGAEGVVDLDRVEL
jgi:hypothetical protein